MFNPPVPPPSLVYLDVSGNPLWTSPDGSLPSWLDFDPNNNIIATGSSYSCRAVIASPSWAPDPLSVQIKLDPVLFSYDNCTCLSGYYSVPPNCIPIPQQVMPIPDRQIMLQTDSNLNSNGASLIATDPTIIIGDYGVVTPNSIADAWFGNQRSIPGLDIEYVVDFSDTQVIENGTHPIFNTYLTSTSMAPTNAVSKLVRSITIYLFISTELINSLTDQLHIYQGTSVNAVDAMVFLYLGNVGYVPASSKDVLITFPTSSDQLQHDPSFLSQYGSQLPDGPILEVVVQIPGVQAVVGFNSRHTSGSHFFAVYVGKSACPAGYFPSSSQLQSIIESSQDDDAILSNLATQSQVIYNQPLQFLYPG